MADAPRTDVPTTDVPYRLTRLGVVMSAEAAKGSCPPVAID